MTNLGHVVPVYRRSLENLERSEVHHKTNSPRDSLVSSQKNVDVFGYDLQKMCDTYLKVFQGELQHVSEDIAEDLRLSLHQHILIVQRLDHLRFYLQNINETNPQ